jgi:hypothetical protein
MHNCSVVSAWVEYPKIEGVELRPEKDPRGAVWTGRAPFGQDIEKRLTLWLDGFRLVLQTEIVHASGNRMIDVGITFNLKGDCAEVAWTNKYHWPDVWEYKFDDLEKDMKKFLKNPLVKDWLKEKMHFIDTPKHLE